MDIPALDVVLRWTHIVAGIVWMGHNYSNVVHRPTFEAMAPGQSAEATGALVMAALSREHAVFRYASIVSWLSGMLMLWQRGFLVDALTLTGYHAVIGMGAWIGTAMMLNVWLVLWPHQKKVLGFVAATSEERGRCARVTFLSSRTNTMLSVPLLFFMAASQHGLSLFG